MASSELRVIAERALSFIPDGAVVGLGTGRAATAFIHALGEKARAGLRVRGIPTSQASADLAQTLGIPLTSFDEVDAIDVAIDGADEVDPQLNLIKGYGGALVREKIVAAAAHRLVILVGPEKLVATLGTRGRLPVEVVPFGLTPCQRVLGELGFTARPRLDKDGQPFVTDNGNAILDCAVGAMSDPEAVERTIRGVAGVVGTGLFLGMTHAVLIERDGSVEVRVRKPST